MISRGHNVIFDGLIGQTHNYSGLSRGNIASMENKNTVSNPKHAALQGLEKIKFIHALGVHQGVFPPHERPHIPTFRALGFSGTDRAIPEKVYAVEPFFLFNYSSAAPMWVANAATFTPSIDSMDGKVHITPANLSRTSHRSIEAHDTAKILKAIFPSQAFFTHHPKLPAGTLFSDEGAANHTRFCKEYGERGMHLFVYGEAMLGKPGEKPIKYPARQTLEACQAIARSHKIPKERVIFAQQHPNAIDSGVFHNDVISVGDKNLFLYHENAFVNTKEIITKIQTIAKTELEMDMQFIAFNEKNILLKTAIQTYFFNSQLIGQSGNTFTLVAPSECRKNSIIHEQIEKLTKDITNPLREAHFLNMTESMQNGGGPGCLSTRVVLTQQELQMVNPKVLFNETLYETLKAWIHKHYRDSLTPKELQDPNLVDEVQSALNELTAILGLGSIYSFQM